MNALRPLTRGPAFCAFLALAILFACTPFRSSQPDSLSGGLALRVQPVTFNLENRAASRIGKLIWRGGVTLSAPHRAFGGWSDLWVAEDGGRLRTVSDDGAWLTARLRYAPDGHLAGLDDAHLGRLKGPDDTWLVGKIWSDAESLAMLPDGSMLVGFERRHRMLRYPAGDESTGGGLAGRPILFPAPAQLPAAPANTGLEAMTVLPDGRLFLLAEDYSLRPGTTIGWIGTLRSQAVTWNRFYYPLVEGFRPTAATVLPDGNIALLERAVSLPAGWRTRIVRLPTSTLVPDAVVLTEELARLETPWASDNFEGIAARRGPGGETLLWLMSDDNFSFLQQTMLLHFALAD
ncbi:esterase-like activity of phytase family protein [Reyranella sp. CPCC 100927]|uniref:esterase-like activity of phytase family protein n=1 Tax=Reyranella sp. CPCC 100927 TaxID=2599616 RepID=UPI0015B57082|nr:esterase-like activity of phytase family protein [Reyranella sp. CPCC 100927]